MLFNSLHFLIFLLVVLIFYYSLPQKYRWVLLLASSYYFYMSWNPKYILLIMISTFIDYVAGISIFKTDSHKRKKFFLGMSLVTNLGLLFFFKYFNFFSSEFVSFLQPLGLPLDPVLLKVLLPVGISFYTFQTLSYTLDVYHGKIKPERHLGIFAVYVSYFPQLVAGPIERAKNLLPQFLEKHDFNPPEFVEGLRLIAWGFFKKLVIADRLAFTVNLIYNNVDNYTGFPLILATVFFAFQIYCDFSGYSDIAIGTSKLMGIKLMENFRRPYFSKSISEFWNRWHISLSTWFRDYVYYPFMRGRFSKVKLYLGLFLTFFLSGIWHGANWTFMVWGSLHGLYLILGIATTNLRAKIDCFTIISKFKKIRVLIKIMIVFILVNFGWIFFRANSLGDAFYVITHIFTNLNLDLSSIKLEVGGWIGLFISLVAILSMEIVHVIQEKGGVGNLLGKIPRWTRWLIYLLFLLTILLFGVFEQTAFIYFQF